MKKTILPLAACLMFVSLSLFLAVKAGNFKVLGAHITNAFQSNPKDSSLTDSSSDSSGMIMNTMEAASGILYQTLGLDKLGLSRQALLFAYKGQQALKDQGRISNTNVLTIADFSQPSTAKRLYIIDLKNLKLLINTYVAHGRNSGLDYAERFSNAPESKESSLGFYVTKQTYSGKHGLSLRIAGLEAGYNDNAESRAVVVHGAPYIGEQRADAAYMGRSFGCPAVPQSIAPKVINLIKDGSCLFIYSPSEKYIHGSKILNG